MNHEPSIREVVATVDDFMKANPFVKDSQMKWIQFTYALEYADKMMDKLDAEMRKSYDPLKVIELEKSIDYWRSSLAKCRTGIQMTSKGSLVN